MEGKAKGGKAKIMNGLTLHLPGSGTFKYRSTPNSTYYVAINTD